MHMTDFDLCDTMQNTYPLKFAYHLVFVCVIIGTLLFNSFIVTRYI